MDVFASFNRIILAPEPDPINKISTKKRLRCPSFDHSDWFKDLEHPIRVLKNAEIILYIIEPRTASFWASIFSLIPFYFSTQFTFAEDWTQGSSDDKRSLWPLYMSTHFLLCKDQQSVALTIFTLTNWHLALLTPLATMLYIDATCLNKKICFVLFCTTPIGTPLGISGRYICRYIVSISVGAY